MLFELAGRKPKFISVPVALMDFIIGAMETIGKVIPSIGVRIIGRCSPNQWQLGAHWCPNHDACCSNACLL